MNDLTVRALAMLLSGASSGAMFYIGCQTAVGLAKDAGDSLENLKDGAAASGYRALGAAADLSRRGETAILNMVRAGIPVGCDDHASNKRKMLTTKLEVDSLTSWRTGLAHKAVCWRATFKKSAGLAGDSSTNRAATLP